MQEFILREGVLNDNTLSLAKEGYVFKDGYIAFIEEYYFLNSWSNGKTVKRFRSRNSLDKYLSKNYKDFELI